MSNSATKLASLGDVPRDLPPSAWRFMCAVKETLEVRNGQRGDPLDQAVTFRSLGATSGIKLISMPGSEPQIDLSQLGGDLSVPPALTNLAASGALANIILTWHVPPYRNHAYTEIWRSTSNDLGQAIRIGMTPGQVYADSVGGDATFYYWVRAVSTANVVGPYNAVGGVMGKTAKDPAYLLSVLTGAITESQLYTTLGNRINLIDGPATLAGSVAAQVQSEANTRTTADSALGTRIDNLTVTVNGNTTSIQSETTARVNADNSLFAQYTVKIDANGYVSGFGLASTSTGAAPTSSFIIRADSFSIANPAGPAILPAMPFVVQTTPTTVNGVAVPVGVYISSAFIMNGVISNAMIGNAAVDNAKIANLDAAKITTGLIAADRLDANTITSKVLSVDAAKITTGFIDIARIQDATITGAKIGAAQIGTAQIANAAIGTAQIAAAAVGTAQIANGSITNALIGTAAVGTAQIANAAIGTAQIADGSITTAKIGNAQIGNAQIANAAVGTLTIAGEAVTTPRGAYLQTVPYGGYSGLSVAVPAGSSTVIVTASCTVTATTNTISPTFRITRSDGTVLYSNAFTFQPPASGATGNSSYSFSATVVDSNASAGATYTFGEYDLSAYLKLNPWESAVAITAIGCKR